MGHTGGFVGFVLSAWICYTTGKCGPDPPIESDPTSGFGGESELLAQKEREKEKMPQPPQKQKG